MIAVVVAVVVENKNKNKNDDHVEGDDDKQNVLLIKSLQTHIQHRYSNTSHAINAGTI